MQDLFITKIRIKKVRHLENIDIELSANEKKHLIITGKNGSGKTSLILKLHHVFASTNRFWELDKNSQCTQNSEVSIRETRLVVFGSIPSYNIREMYDRNLFVTLPADRKLKLDIPKAIEAVKSEFLSSEMFLKYLLYLNYQKMYAKTNGDKAEADKVEKWFDLFVNTLREIYDCPTLELRYNVGDLSLKSSCPTENRLVWTKWLMVTHLYFIL